MVPIQTDVKQTMTSESDVQTQLARLSSQKERTQCRCRPGCMERQCGMGDCFIFLGFSSTFNRFASSLLSVCLIFTPGNSTIRETEREGPPSPSPFLLRRVVGDRDNDHHYDQHRSQHYNMYNYHHPDSTSSLKLPLETRRTRKYNMHASGTNSTRCQDVDTGPAKGN